MVKKMCNAAGIEGKFTNHSLRASGATALFQSEAPEKVIQEFTGHRSVKALRQYEKVGSQQKQAACNILNGGAPATSFSTKVEKLHSVQQSPNLLSQQALFPPNNASGITTMPNISPHINSSGNCTVNFTVNVCPSENFTIGNAQHSSSSKENYQYLFDELDLDELFNMN